MCDERLYMINGTQKSMCLLDLTAAFDTVDHDLLMLMSSPQHFGYWSSLVVVSNF